MVNKSLAEFIFQSRHAFIRQFNNGAYLFFGAMESPAAIFLWRAIICKIGLRSWVELGEYSIGDYQQIRRRYYPDRADFKNYHPLNAFRR